MSINSGNLRVDFLLNDGSQGTKFLELSVDYHRLALMMNIVIDVDCCVGQIIQALRKHTGN